MVTLTKEEAIEILSNMKSKLQDFYDKYELKALEMALESLKAEEIPKSYGEWIGHEENGDYWVECSKCHSNHGLATNFCPDCGIKMKNEEE